MKNTGSKFNVFAFLILLMYLSTFSLFTFDLVNAATDNEEDGEEKEELYDKYKEIEKEKEKTKKLIDLKEKETNIIGSQVNKLENESRRIEGDIQTNKKEIDKISSEIDRIEKTIKQKESRINIQKQILSKIIREHYQGNSDTNNFFITTKNTADPSLFTDSNRIDQTAENLSNVMNSIIQEQAELVEEKNGLGKKTTEIKDTKYELEKRNEYLESTRNHKEGLIIQAENEKKKYETKLSKLEQEQLSIQDEINEIDYDHAGDYSNSDLPSKSKADLSRPVVNPYVITQGYGRTSFSHNYKGGKHNGVDYVAKGDKKIMAAADGRVAGTGNMGYYGYGRWVAIDHENGLITLYGHMSSVKVSKGDKVDKGDKIGVMGSTGFSTGAHLHFTVFVAKTFAIVKSSSVSGIYIPTGATVNPASYIN